MSSLAMQWLVILWHIMLEGRQKCNFQTSANSFRRTIESLHVELSGIFSRRPPILCLMDLLLHVRCFNTVKLCNALGQ